ncbi:ABC transporter ATP-binding protein [Microbacterium halophytorum]|uniref:ABC transporter ATP-binding protein n=1 Tax=Microbacterium halophytorum TaxID=2067568 RepID=UPI000CFC2D89|nr:ABC transporter ATP-binding protein [Microbacterium halophytorum]
MKLSLDGISQQYVTDKGETIDALGATDLEIDEGQFVCVVGSSGCGKSTLLNIIAGFLEPTTGTVKMDGEAIAGPARQRGVVFQQPTLFPWLTVHKNVEFGLKIKGVSAAERERKASEALATVGLADFHESKPYELSGGMQQRTQIARVLANDPEIILMDEPFGALDAITREKLQNDLLDLSREKKKTIFFITHSVDEAIVLGDRVIVMSPRPGRVVRDEPIGISKKYGRPLRGAELRETPEFAEMRDSIAASIGMAAA